MKGGDLLAFLLHLQKECGGTIPFERYMREALYHPSFGYYSAQIRDVGAAGDFSTSATLDKRLGPAIAAWIGDRARKLGWRRIPVIEIGAGSGNLAHSVLRHLDWRTRWRTDYMIHESSPVLRKHQQALLRWRRVRWVESLPEALARTNGRALLFSNELVDAFPCRLFQFIDREWRELGVRITEQGTLSEIPLGSVPGEQTSWFSQFAPPSEGQRVERLDSFRDWTAGWGKDWREGAMLTIDYGEKAERLYRQRLSGSLRAYWRHHRFAGRDLYARFGKQDLTTDVNFSDLIAWGEHLGWRSSPLTTQREFVATWLLQQKEKTSTSYGALSDRFSTPGEAGDAFKVLEQTPG